MTDRQTKLRRLDGFRRRIPNVSASASSAILREAVSGLPDVLHCQGLQQARDIKFDESTPYGKAHSILRLQRTSGTVLDLVFVNPLAQIHIAAKKLEGFSLCLLNLLQFKPRTHDDPWGLVLYADEVVPGEAVKKAKMHGRSGSSTILFSSSARRCSQTRTHGLTPLW